MAAVDIDKAIKIATDIVRIAYRSHKLQNLTNRLVRQDVEEHLELESGTLEEKVYKKQLNEAIAAAVEELKAQDTVELDVSEKKEKQNETAKPVSSAKKRKPQDSGEAVEAKKTKKRATALSKSKESDEGADSIEATPEAKGKKRKSSGSSKSNTEKSVSKANGKVTVLEDKSKSYKSKDVIESDDDGIPILKSDTENEVEPVVSQKKSKKPETSSSQTEKSLDSSSKKTLDTKSKATDTTLENVTEGDIKSDSEISVLLDGPPTMRENGMAKTKVKARKSKENVKEKKSKGKKEGKELSPDEEQIKKLKSFVVACGVRKVWSKELKDCDTPSSQIAHLRGMLTELGMKGRFSLEQAKTIKAKRDLAKEMEDVVEFAQRHSGNRPKRAAAQKEPVNVDASSNEEGSEAESAPSRRPKNAHRSIMAFLDDQSDED